MLGQKDLTVEVGDGILNIRVGAIIMRENKILMVGNDRSDYYYSVGGRVKMGESAEDAVVREVFEETGVKMEVERLGFVHENFFYGDAPSNMGKPIYEISFFFYMKVPEDFASVCYSFTDDISKEHRTWQELDTEKTYYPEFFREELKHPVKDVRHIVTREY